MAALQATCGWGRKGRPLLGRGFREDRLGDQDRALAGQFRAVRVRSLLAFWLLAFVITWASGMVVVLSKQARFVNGAQVRAGAYDLPLGLTVALLLLQAFGPAVAALAVSAWEAGSQGVVHLFRQLLRWRADARFYLLALLLPTALTLLASAIWAGARRELPAHWLLLAPAFQFLALPVGPWGEEVGWRGFAQPRLQERLSWPLASLVVGLMWFTWHQWPLLTPAAGPLDFPGLAVFFVYIVSAAVLFGWIYNGGGCRLPVAWASHAGLNAVGPSSAPFVLIALVFAAAAGAATLSGDRLLPASRAPLPSLR
jgi:uncharacterized protein